MPLIPLHSSLGSASYVQSSLTREKNENFANNGWCYDGSQSSWGDSHLRCLGFILLAPS